MKKNKILYLIILCLTFGSCGDWLTINPQDQVKEKELYSTAGGFYNQINGIYKVMSEGTLYGRELSFGMIDAMAQYYDMGNYSNSGNYDYRNASKFDYLVTSGIKDMTDAIWETSYNAITNCNSVINYATEADSMLFPSRETERRCILGEAYALRAMLHFDIMRLYAPSLVVNNSGSFVPYVKEFPVHIPTNVNTKEYINNVISDLLVAHDLVKSIDSLSAGVSQVNSRFEFAGNPTTGRFLSYRGYRLNFYAIKALLARVYLYAGMEREALKYANQLIELHEKSNWFTYNSKYNMTGYGNMKLYGDVIFALFNNLEYRRFEEANPIIAYNDADYMSLLEYSSMFGSEESADMRSLQYMIESGNYVPIKYAEVKEGTSANHSNKMIPMLRMSEMYYIAAECLYNSDPVKAAANLAYVRNKRGVKAVLSTTSNKADFVQQILNDVRREQIGEGQLFFFYKRLNLPVYFSEGKYLNPGKGFILPIPDSNTIL